MRFGTLVNMHKDWHGGEEIIEWSYSFYTKSILVASYNLRLNHWCLMDYFYTTFLGLDCGSCIGVFAASESSQISFKISKFGLFSKKTTYIHVQQRTFKAELFKKKNIYINIEYNKNPLKVFDGPKHKWGWSWWHNNCCRFILLWVDIYKSFHFQILIVNLKHFIVINEKCQCHIFCFSIELVFVAGFFIYDWLKISVSNFWHSLMWQWWYYCCYIRCRISGVCVKKT